MDSDVEMDEEVFSENEEEDPVFEEVKEGSSEQREESNWETLWRQALQVEGDVIGEDEQQTEEEPSGDEEADPSAGEGEGEGDGEGVDPTDHGLDCPICYDRWTAEGPHRVCCIPCGHLYGRSCLDSWIEKCGKKAAKCPTCNIRFKKRRIVNLYVPIVAIQNNELEKEVLSLREKNVQLQTQKEKYELELQIREVRNILERTHTQLDTRQSGRKMHGEVVDQLQEQVRKLLDALQDFQ